MRYDVTTEPSQGRVAFHKVEANGTPVMATGLVESSQQEIDEVVRIITERAASFNVVPVGYTLTVVTLTDAFRSRLGAELKSLASKNKTMGQFLCHVRIVALPEIAEQVDGRDSVVVLREDRAWASAAAVRRAGGRRRTCHAAGCAGAVRPPSRYRFGVRRV